MIIFNSTGGMTFRHIHEGVSDASDIRSVTVRDLDRAPELLFSHRYESILLLEGGSDINPALYGQSMTHTYGVHTTRDLREIFLWTVARRYKIPILGICRGHQLMAALAGGQLYQDIRACMGISHGGRHDIRITVPNQDSASFELGTEAVSFYEMMRDTNPHPFTDSSMDDAGFVDRVYRHGTTVVNSMHHQAVSVQPPNSRVVATALDGVVEAIVYPYGLGVQWHPEVMGHIQMAQWVWETFRCQPSD